MAGRAVILHRQVTRVDVIEIDSCLSEDHILSNTVTDHPVEEGINVTDHSRPEPDRVNLRCFVSNTPLSVEQRSRAIRSGNVEFQTSEETSTRLSTTQVNGRGADAYQKLKKIRDEGAMVEVVTTLRTYGVSATEGMMVESISIPRSRDNFDGLEFSISLKQVRIVKNRRSQVKQRAIQTRKKKVDGHKTTEPPKEKTSELYDTYKGNGIVNKATGFNPLGGLPGAG